MKKLLLALCIFLSGSSLLFAQNLVVNSGFEEGMSGWHEHLSGGAKAKGTIDRTVSHSGKASFKLTNASGFAPNVYYRIFTFVPVKPNTKYLMGAWVKGKGVGRCWIGGSPNWFLKNAFPAGDYDWRWVCTEYTTGPKETTFELILLTESNTETLWIDDVYMGLAQGGAQGILYTPQISKGLPADSRFYPALPIEEKDKSPAVKVRIPGDPGFGFDAKINYDAENLIFNVDIVDPTVTKVIPGKDMWYSDSIQIGLDIQPERPKDGYGATCYELYFAFDQTQGKVIQYPGQVGGADPLYWKDLEAKANKTATGYHLEIFFPWKRMRLDTEGLPKVLGINILANDGQSDYKGRRWVEWTYGIGWGIKTPDRFARVVLAQKNQPSVGYFLYDSKPVYDKKDFLIGRYVEYTLRSRPTQEIKLLCDSPDSNPLFTWGNTKLPAVSAGSIREFAFMLPAAQLEKEGQFKLAGQIDNQLFTDAPFDRINLAARITELLDQNEKRVAAIKKALAQKPALAANAYIEMGVTIAERFFPRVRKPAEWQTLDWSMRQMKEVAWVLDETEKRLADKTFFDSPKPTGKAVEIRDGVFFTEAKTAEGGPEIRPFYFGGFGHFGTVCGQSPQLRKMGYSMIQLESGPASLWGDGNLDQLAQGRVDGVKLASANNMKVSFLLSPHYFPEWAVAQAPEVVVPGGFNKFDVNHPVARAAIAKWIGVIVGKKTGNEPSILSYCLMNEPSYGQSGRTKVSRPLWTQYLKKKHQTVEVINTLYGTTYKSIEEVPVPPDEYPQAISKRRMYYDWVMFNQENFADWHKFMNDEIKKYAPHKFTETKMLDNTLAYGIVGAGVDPELICNTLDIAGNDCWVLWPGGKYSFNWLQMEVWYDLLHSFKNQPISNTENHIMPDGTTVGDDIPPEHTYTVFWQEALHHQGAHATWTWEEPVSPGLAGHVSLRPANIYGGGKAMLDLNRLAQEVTAINQAKPKVAILFSIPSIFWEKDLEETVKNIYPALNFMGLQITFVSERQLAKGQYADVGWIILPHTTHVFDSTIKGLSVFVAKGGKLIRVGEDNLAFDEYHRKRPLGPEFSQAVQIRLKDDSPQSASILRQTLTNQGLKLVDLQEADNKTPAWGVEFRTVEYQGRLLAPITNLLAKPVTVKLAIQGRAVDLITGQEVDLNRLTLKPMEPLLVQISP